MTLLTINTPNSPDTLVADLLALGFEGFEETETSLLAYIPTKDFDEDAIIELADKYPFTYKIEIIQPKNWNEEWESNFEPITVYSIHNQKPFLGIRAGFHERFPNLEEIVITPKMSFGTGHHATTYMVMQLMENLPIKDKNVLDFGTGTGILAILAAKKGASQIMAIDNDTWCIENANENIAINNCKQIEVRHIDDFQTKQLYHIVLANVTYDIIMANLHIFMQSLLPNGTLIVSGVLDSNIETLKKHLLRIGLENNFVLTKQNWAAIQFNKV